MRGFVIGRPGGVEIRIHPSIVVIVVLIVLDLATGPFRYWHPTWSTPLVWTLAIAAALLFVASVLLHELAHTAVARAYGMSVSSITLFLFGGVSNIEREPPSPKIEFLVAAVGPLTSIVLGVVLLALGALSARPVLGAEDPATAAALLSPGTTLLGWLGSINVLVGVFNLLPAFPLDGGRVLRSALWAATGNLVAATRWASGLGRTIGYLMIAAGILMFFGARIPFLGTGPVAGMWFAFIGWFLAQAAAGVYTQTVLTRALEDIRVADLMTPQVDPIPTDLPVAALVERFMKHDHRAFPVVEGDTLVGLVCLEDVRKIPREDWPHTVVSAIMTPRDQLHVVTPNSPASEALRTLGQRCVDQVPVVESGHLLGLVRREDIVRWLQLSSEVPV